MIWTGTSGFQCKEWQGGFYPAGMSPPKMLNFYAQHFPTTEINYTFRTVPSDHSIANWIDQTPAQFRFTLKAPEKITHRQRLKYSDSSIQAFADVALKLGPKLGALLFQLPPNFECDVPLLKEFLPLIPAGLVPAFEFRHKSWFIPSVFSTLREHNATLCIAESEDFKTPVEFTGTTAYFRLRRDKYTATELSRWAEIIDAQSSKLTDIYIYFKHEDTGTGPVLAKQLMDLLDVKPPAGDTGNSELPSNP